MHIIRAYVDSSNGIYGFEAFSSYFKRDFTEGCNNKIKVIKRVSFGVRSFDYFRNRILHCTSLT